MLLLRVSLSAFAKQAARVPSYAFYPTISITCTNTATNGPTKDPAADAASTAPASSDFSNFTAASSTFTNTRFVVCSSHDHVG